MLKKNKRLITQRGFTLMEILIALFIFTLLSMMFVTALHSVMNAASGTEQSAARLQELQRTLLIVSRDIEQTLNRPIVGNNGREEVAFKGEQRVFSFTHGGIADPMGAMRRSSLQRVTYYWKEKHLYRVTWPVLDLAPETKYAERMLMDNVEDAQFRYVDNDGKLQRDWPSKESAKPTPLPKAVYFELTLKNWGKIKQLYVIPAQANANIPPPPSNNKT